MATGRARKAPRSPRAGATPARPDPRRGDFFVLPTRAPKLRTLAGQARSFYSLSLFRAFLWLSLPITSVLHYIIEAAMVKNTVGHSQSTTISKWYTDIHEHTVLVQNAKDAEGTSRGFLT